MHQPVTAQWIASYLRISNDPLKLAAGVGRQRKDNRAIAETRWPDREIREYTDNDISASKYSRRTRPAFRQMCEDIEQGRVYAMVGWNFDRTFRKPSELETFLDLCDRVKFTRAVTAQGDVDLTTDDGKLHARIMVAVAAKSSDDTSRRVRRALRDRDENGLHRGGRVVYGYRMVKGEPVLQPHAAKQVREAARRVLAGEPLRTIAASMPAGAPRTGAGVRRMLLSPTLVARTRTGARGTWEPILTDVQAAELHAMFRDPDRRVKAPSGDRVWWLSGLVWCGKCGERLNVTTVRNQVRAYACKQPRKGAACSGVSIRVDRLHWHCEAALFSFLVVKESVGMGSASGGDDTADSHVVEDVSLELRLAELASLYATGGISRAEWVAAREAIIPHDVLPDPRVVLRPVPNLQERWDELTPGERHQYASRVIDRVTIHPRVPGAAKWQPDRIRIQWLQ